MSEENNKSAAVNEQQQTQANEPWYMEEPARRTFFKRIAAGGGGALLTGVGSYGLAMHSLQGQEVTDYPLIDENLFKPKPQQDTILNFVSSKALNKKYPERNEQYNRLQKVCPHK